MTESHTIALVRRAVEEIWNKGELDVADAIFASSYINHMGLITDLVIGPEAIKISAALYRTAFPDLQIQIDYLDADRDTVRLRWTAHTSAQPATLSGSFVSRIVGNQIAESWAAWDQAILRQWLSRPS